MERSDEHPRKRRGAEIVAAQLRSAPLTCSDPEHPKHAQWVTCLVSMLAMQELGRYQLPGIVYRSLQHGAVHCHASTWHNGPHLVTVSLCIQNAINKMQL